MPVSTTDRWRRWRRWRARGGGGAKLTKNARLRHALNPLASPEGAMGTVEMIVSTAVAGMIYALTCGQPLTIIGSTGPVLAFIAVLFGIAQSLSLPFLPLYAWTGLWSALYLGLCSIFSVSNVINYLTRFTDEIFANLISFIFIYEACKDLTGLINNPAVSPAQAYLSIIIAFGTYMVATTLKGFRSSPLFVKRIRRSTRTCARASVCTPVHPYTHKYACKHANPPTYFHTHAFTTSG